MSNEKRIAKTKDLTQINWRRCHGKDATKTSSIGSDRSVLCPNSEVEYHTTEYHRIPYDTT